jgi:lipopolysaccharide transport system ATP-binding protein
MSKSVIFQNVSKTYTRGHAPSFREDTSYAVQRLFGRTPQRNPVEALRNVSFEIDQGARLAIMGANGSGKTTALRLLSRVTYPTSGVIRVAGRVGGLIDVGAGLHPDLTGRENIWLYGRILGLRRNDIGKHFDEIVDFADIGIAIDQPLKQYSSGMMVRVGFAIASYLEPDILVVDEAIAVGDAGFQERCLKRMEAITDAGATLIFVSHSSAMVARLCPEGLLLKTGQLIDSGPIDRIVARYLNDVVSTQSEIKTATDAITVRSWDYSFIPHAGRFLGDLTVRLHLHAARPLRDPRFIIDVGHSRRGALLRCSMIADGESIGTVQGDFMVSCSLSELPLDAGEYEIWSAAVGEQQTEVLLTPRRLGFAVFGHAGQRPRRSGGGLDDRGKPLLQAPYRWEVSSTEPLDLQRVKHRMTSH